MRCIMHIPVTSVAAAAAAAASITQKSEQISAQKIV